MDELQSNIDELDIEDLGPDNERLYDDRDIDEYVNAMVDQLGGRRGTYLIDRTINDTDDNRDVDRDAGVIAITPPVQTTDGNPYGVTPIDSFLDIQHQDDTMIGYIDDLLQEEDRDTLVDLIHTHHVHSIREDLGDRIDRQDLSLDDIHEKLREWQQDLLQQSPKDVFDEIMVPLQQGGNINNARILFPYNLDNANHWVLGEINIRRVGHTYSATIEAHDPYGGGTMSTADHLKVKEAIERRIKEMDPQAQVLTRHAPMDSRYLNGRQDRDDGVSCGVITADDLLKRVKDETLDRDNTYPVGAPQLRQNQLDVMGQVGNDRFVERNRQKTVDEQTRGRVSDLVEEMFGDRDSLSDPQREIKEAILHNIQNERNMEAVENAEMVLGHMMRVGVEGPELATEFFTGGHFLLPQGNVPLDDDLYTAMSEIGVPRHSGHYGGQDPLKHDQTHPSERKKIYEEQYKNSGIRGYTWTKPDDYEFYKRETGVRCGSILPEVLFTQCIDPETGNIAIGMQAERTASNITSTISSGKDGVKHWWKEQNIGPYGKSHRHDSNPIVIENENDKSYLTQDTHTIYESIDKESPFCGDFLTLPEEEREERFKPITSNIRDEVSQQVETMFGKEDLTQEQQRIKDAVLDKVNNERNPKALQNTQVVLDHMMNVGVQGPELATQFFTGGHFLLPQGKNPPKEDLYQTLLNNKVGVPRFSSHYSSGKAIKEDYLGSKDQTHPSERKETAEHDYKNRWKIRKATTKYSPESYKFYKREMGVSCGDIIPQVLFTQAIDPETGEIGIGFQSERSPAEDTLGHGKDFVTYQRTGENVGAHGTSEHLDSKPIVIYNKQDLSYLAPDSHTIYEVNTRGYRGSSTGPSCGDYLRLSEEDRANKFKQVEEVDKGKGKVQKESKDKTRKKRTERRRRRRHSIATRLDKNKETTSLAKANVRKRRAKSISKVKTKVEEVKEQAKQNGSQQTEVKKRRSSDKGKGR